MVCRVGRTTSWLMRLVSRPPMSLSTSGALTPADQTTSSAAMTVPSGEHDAVGADLGDAGAGADVDVERVQEFGGRLGDALGQGGEDARGGLDEDDADVAGGVDLVEAVGDDSADGAVQLGGEFGAGGAGADDGDVELAGADRAGLGVGAQAGVDQASVEAAGLFGGLERDGELGGAGGAEIVGDAADRHDERVIGDAGGGGDLAACFVMGGAEEEALIRAVQAGDVAEAVGEMMPVGLGEVVELVVGAREAAGGDGVQEGFPEMGAVALDEGDAGLAAAAERVAELGDELESGGPAPGDDDVREIGAGDARRRLGCGDAGRRHGSTPCRLPSRVGAD